MILSMKSLTDKELQTQYFQLVTEAKTAPAAERADLVKRINAMRDELLTRGIDPNTELD